MKEFQDSYNLNRKISGDNIFSNLGRQLDLDLENIVGFQSVQRYWRIDYLLSEMSQDISYLDESIELMPLFRDTIPQTIEQENRILELVKLIGKGGFSKVYLARTISNNNYFALKIFNKKFITENNFDDLVLNEHEILTRIQGDPFLSQLKLSFQDVIFSDKLEQNLIFLTQKLTHQQENIYFLIDYAGGGDFFGFFQRHGNLKESQIKYLIGQVMIGINQLHSKNIIYRDLKLENIFLDINGNAVLGDFGLSKILTSKHARRTSIAGSYDYMSPEMLSQQSYSMMTDFYSLGVLIYELLTGLPPFYGQKQKEKLDSQLQTKIKFDKTLSQSSKSLILGLLNPDETQRIGYKHGIIEVFEHPWFEGTDFEPIRKGKRSPFNLLSTKHEKERSLLQYLQITDDYPSPDILNIKDEQYFLQDYLEPPKGPKLNQLRTEFYVNSKYLLNSANKNETQEVLIN